MPVLGQVIIDVTKLDGLVASIEQTVRAAVADALMQTADDEEPRVAMRLREVAFALADATGGDDAENDATR